MVETPPPWAPAAKVYYDGCAMDNFLFFRIFSLLLDTPSYRDACSEMFILLT
jgi:hypothetical protein